MEHNAIYEQYPYLYDTIYGGDAQSSLEFVVWLMDELDLSSSSQILDIGSGTGQLLIPLTKRGFQITGIEPFEGMIDITKSKAKELGATVTVTKGSFQTLDEQETRDFIFGINGSFNYIHDFDEIQSSFRKLFTALKPGGFLLLDLTNFEAIIKRYQHPVMEEFEVAGKQIVSHIAHDIDLPSATWIHTTSLFIQEGEKWTRVKDIHRLSMISLREIKIHGRDAGFEYVRFFSSYKDREGEMHEGARLMVLFRKPSHGSTPA